MREKWSPETRTQIQIYTVSGVLIATLCFAFMNWDHIATFLSKIWTAINPFIWGFCIAFVLSPLRRLCEEKWLSNALIPQRAKRTIAVVFSLIVLLLVIVMFFYILIPQLISSFETLASSMDGYVSRLEKFLNSIGQSEEADEILIAFYDSIKENILSWIGSSGLIVTKFFGYSVTVVKGVFNFLVGIIIAVYFLLDQERWVRQFKKICYASLSQEGAEEIFRIINLTAHMLDNFIFGKALDSLVIGIACGICCGLMKIPYTPLIAFIVGLTNMIPVFGPFIGAIPCAFILMIISPAKALEFILFILVLQQIDGNILGPYILGDSMGLPPLWIMVAIIVGGALWGILGMFLGVPLFSVVYMLVKEIVEKRLKERRIRVD